MEDRMHLELESQHFDTQYIQHLNQLGKSYQGFIRKVFGILTAQIAYTILFCGLVISTDILNLFSQAIGPLLIVSIFGIFFSLIALVCCRSNARTYPLNYVLLGIFVRSSQTISQSFLVSTFCASFDPQQVILAAGMTLVITAALTLFAWKSNVQFHYGKACFVLFVVDVLIFIPLWLFTSGMTFYLVRAMQIWCSLGVVIYGFYLVLDVKLILDNGKYGLSYDDYIIGALFIYIDIVQIFLYLLRILAALKRND